MPFSKTAEEIQGWMDLDEQREREDELLEESQPSVMELGKGQRLVTLIVPSDCGVVVFRNHYDGKRTSLPICEPKSPL